MREPRNRAHGPYQHGKKWRVVLVRSDGTRGVESFESEAEAYRWLDDAQQEASGRTVSGAVEAYLEAMTDRGLKVPSIQRSLNHLRQLLSLDQHGPRPLSWMCKAGRADALYEAAQKQAGGERYANDTHRNALNEGKAFGKFCVKRKWIKLNPFADVEGIGKRKHGKPQLRVDEARLLIDHCLALCAPKAKPEPVAVIVALLLGPRATEIVDRDVRDLDDGGRLLWIPDSKTVAGRRNLEVPELLRPLLLALAKDKIGAAPLFHDRHGKRPSRNWISYWCRKMCRCAGVPELNPHSLRGTHGSIARRGGASGEVVAAQLGHSGQAITHRAYVTAEAVNAGTASAMLRVIDGGRVGNSAGNSNG